MTDADHVARRLLARARRHNIRLEPAGTTVRVFADHPAPPLLIRQLRAYGPRLARALEAERTPASPSPEPPPRPTAVPDREPLGFTVPVDWPDAWSELAELRELAAKVDYVPNRFTRTVVANWGPGSWPTTPDWAAACCGAATSQTMEIACLLVATWRYRRTLIRRCALDLPASYETIVSVARAWRTVNGRRGAALQHGLAEVGFEGVPSARLARVAQRFGRRTRFVLADAVENARCVVAARAALRHRPLPADVAGEVRELARRLRLAVFWTLLSPAEWTAWRLHGDEVRSPVPVWVRVEPARPL